ncbi:MAG TPA: outer membrane beta-barrel protein [Steroidobacteraceae bacterium]|jgi:hypothetical protein|nr:outer membrane beta-barrel protein [Steroidobacteraceae bacterium]
MIKPSSLVRSLAGTLATVALPLGVPLALGLSAAGTAAAQSAAYAPSPDLSATPRNGQSADQQAADNRECQHWAQDQTGFDAQRPGGVTAPDYAASRSRYARAMGACLEAHGYTVHYTPPAGVAPPAQAYAPPPPPPPAYGGPYAEHRRPPTLAWSPVHAHVDTGFTITAANAGTYLDDGWNAGAGATLFPVESIPVGLRIDGSYSRFEASDNLLNQTNADIGHSNVYGGNVDLQVNLPVVWSQRFYVFGGIGWYREQTVLHQISFFDGGFCDYYYDCGGYARITGTEHYTTSWHDSWNTGIGWEMALADHLSLFAEASYLRIRPNADGQQFVPIRVGVRF